MNTAQSMSSLLHIDDTTHLFRSKNPEVMIGNNELSDIFIFSSKKTYQDLIRSHDILNASYRKWTGEGDLFRIQGPEEWAEVCSRTFTSARETKYQSFQYKLLSRISPCRTYLIQIKVVTSDQCPFCDATNDLAHFFISCPTTKLFWQNLQRTASRTSEWSLFHTRKSF